MCEKVVGIFFPLRGRQYGRGNKGRQILRPDDNIILLQDREQLSKLQIMKN